MVYSMEWHEAAEEAKLDWLKRAVAEARNGDEALDVPFDDDLIDNLFAETAEVESVR